MIHPPQKRCDKWVRSPPDSLVTSLMDSLDMEWFAVLVLSRKKDESVRIGSDIVITIIEIRGDKIRLGFEAPKDVSIHRQEVYEKIMLGEGKIAS